MIWLRPFFLCSPFCERLTCSLNNSLIITRNSCQVLLFLGCVDADQKTAKHNLSKGRSLLIYIGIKYSLQASLVRMVTGGEKEQLMTCPKEHKIYLKNRKGFVKLALTYGAHLVPMVRDMTRVSLNNGFGVLIYDWHVLNSTHLVKMNVTTYRLLLWVCYNSTLFLTNLSKYIILQPRGSGYKRNSDSGSVCRGNLSDHYYVSF